MKKSLLKLPLFIILSLTSCGGQKTTSVEEKTFKTYINYTFDELNVGDLIDNYHDDYALFEYYEGDGFVASSKDDNGDVWISTTNKNGWGLVYTYAYEGHVKAKLKDFAMSYRMRIPSYSTQLEGNMEGGSCILWNPTFGRYDFAIHYENQDNGSDGNSIDLWSSMDVATGPYATTQNKDAWGDRGSKVRSFSLSEDKIYQVTTMCKYEGIDNFGDELMTFYAFIDDQLIIKKEHLPFWDGGFGFRGLSSTIEYGDLIVTDFPDICPDGIDHYSDDENSIYVTKNYSRIGAPVLSQEGTLISWEPIENAGGYSIYFNEKRVGFEKEPRFDFCDIYGVGTIKVQAQPSSFTYLMSERSSIDIYHPAQQLPAPVLYLEDNVVTWGEVSGAAEYDIFVNGVKDATQVGTTYRINQSEVGDYSITVRAISRSNAYTSSSLSNEVIYSISGLETPVLEYLSASKTLVWNAIENADAYLVYINDKDAKQISDNSYVISETEFSARVRAIDTTNTYKSSKLSNIVSSHPLLTLDAPLLKYKGNGLLSWNKVENSSGYEVYKNGYYYASTTSTNYIISENGVYSIVAVGNHKTILNSDHSNSFTSQPDGVKPALYYDEIAYQNIGEVANYGWNIYETNARYVIKDRTDGITWIGSNDISRFNETWFWAKNNDNSFLENWTFSSYVKKVNDTADAVQMMFGTSADRGRYSCFFYFLDGGSMQVYHDGRTVANSYEEDMGGTLELQNSVTLENNKVSKITIFHSKQSNGKARIVCYVDDVCVIDKRDLTLAVGDYGLWLNEGVDCWFGNPTVTTLDNAPDTRYVNGKEIVLNAPIAELDNGVISWTNQDYCFGYDIYLNGCKEASLSSNVTSYTPTLSGYYEIVARGNGTSVLDSVFSNKIIL